jgi:choline monooxygenase
MPSRLPPFELDLARGSTLPAFPYTDDAILAAERAKIFGRTWQPIARAEDVAAPGTYATAEIDGKPLVVSRDAGGELRCFYNVCRHRAGPVAIGKGARKSLTCKYHGWTYGLDGRLATTPELGDAADFDKDCHGLRPVRVEAWGPFVFGQVPHASCTSGRGSTELRCWMHRFQGLSRRRSRANLLPSSAAMHKISVARNRYSRC